MFDLVLELRFELEVGYIGLGSIWSSTRILIELN